MRRLQALLHRFWEWYTWHEDLSKLTPEERYHRWYTDNDPR